MTYVENGIGPKDSAYWHFRTNNLDKDYIKYVCSLAEHEKVDWIVVGNIETGEVEKGDHFHVAIKMKMTTRESSMKTLFKLNQKKLSFSYYLCTKYSNSTVEQLIKYVVKNGVYFSSKEEEVQQKDNNNEKELKNKDSKELYQERIRRGKANDWQWFQDHDPKWTLSAEYSKLYAKYFRAGADNTVKPITGKLTHYWIYGPSGTGKSSSIEYLYPNRYKKIMTNEKWDGYDNTFEGHQVVHIDELNSFNSLEKGMEGLDGLKCKVDRNPFAVRKNYGTDIINIRPKSFIITSNYTPSQLLTKVEERGFNVDIEGQCLTRKFKVVHVTKWLHMNRLGCIPNRGIFDFTKEGETERFQKEYKEYQDSLLKNDYEDDYIR